MLNIDLGCGTKKREGYIGIDSIGFPGVDYCFDIGSERWPFDDDSVDAAYCGHTLEHLTNPERIFFSNELWRVLKVGAKAEIRVPHWANALAYGDPTHQWPPVSEAWPQYLARHWREVEAPHTAPLLRCNFSQEPRTLEFGGQAQRDQNLRHMLALCHWRDIARDMVFVLVKAPWDVNVTVGMPWD